MIKVELEKNITINCNVSNKTIAVNYVTGRKRYTCYECDKSIQPKEDHYYTVINTTLVPIDNVKMLGELTVFFKQNSMKRRFHTECFSYRDEYKYLEVRKAKQHFNKL